jgi:NADPH-dependent glutamate synthase beta subunit-like oxidoreductase
MYHVKSWNCHLRSFWWKEAKANSTRRANRVPCPFLVAGCCAVYEVRRVHQLERLSRPPDARTAESVAALAEHLSPVDRARRRRRAALFDRHAEIHATDEGRVTTLHGVRVESVRTERGFAFEPVAGSEFELRADLVLLAMGFVGPVRARTAWLVEGLRALTGGVFGKNVPLS